MRILVVFVTMLFSISLADANQQALLRVQWQQLSLQNNLLSDAEKLERIQALSSLISLNKNSPTQVVQTPLELFESGEATEAELAFSKWIMAKKLGLPAEQFRLVYVQNKENLSRQVWLAWFGDDQVKLITSSDIIERSSSVKKYQSEVEIISVVDPEHILTSRNNARVTNGAQQLTII
ncbi:hypothetical protein [Psychrosphaera aestuarii]|uniref:hypothetical protein n=1 Tax=Psychrosphaera aestuarii TaxID=1266052 RepID=UPI001B33A808|nr:hypothetical protein [Psychrosphaera aestuarii]